MLKTLTARVAQIKAVDDGSAPEGTFEAVVSVFGNIDYAGDRVVKGAFAKSLTTWASSGDPIPVVWSHQWQDPEMHIGGVIEAEERDEGLWVKAELDIEDPVAAKVWRLLKSRRVREFSFAYDVLDEKRQNGANELLELDVIEVGPTLKGMNPNTLLLDAKSRREARAARAEAAKAAAKAEDGDGEDTHVPPQKVQDNAQAALDAIENGDAGEGFTDTGRARAEQLAAGESVPLSEVRDISAWFARHEGDEGRDEQGNPAWVAWMAWGGDEGREWADGIVASADEEDDSEDGSTGTSSRSGGRKARVTLDGSIEQLQDRLRAAITDWASAAFPAYAIYLAGLEATWPETATVCAYVETWDQPWGGGDYYQASYEVDEDGVVALGEPEIVELIGVIAPKSATAAAAEKKASAPVTTSADPLADPDWVRAQVDLVELDL